MAKNDCTVRALALALDIPAPTVADRLSQDGYRAGRGFHLGRWIACQTAPAIGQPEHVFGYRAEWIAAPAVKGLSRHTPQTFASAHAKGRYIIKQARHVVAVVDGQVLMESRRPDGGCVYGAWKFARIEAQA